MRIKTKQEIEREIEQGKSDIMQYEKYFLKKKSAFYRLRKIAECISPGSKVLDAGCSLGETQYFLKDKKIDYWGLELSKTRAEFAKIKTKGRVKIGNVLKMPFKENEFDYVILGEIIEHVENPSKLLKECKRVLKTGGKIVGSTPNATDFLRIVKATLRKEEGSSQHINLFSPYEMRNLMKYSGLKNPKIKVIGFKIFPGFNGIHANWLDKIFPLLGKCIIFIGEK